ncbi:MAG: hypothetical protein JW863_07830 [Chitinispirillaceae bacterium]|nr:hypothetical protein [Chitinispirillaceae bacterium]
MKPDFRKSGVHLFAGFFFAVVLTVAFVKNSWYPIRAIGGEESAGTWLSGAMLVIAMTLSLVAGKRRGLFPWFLFAAFFALAAADERFMFHEQLKQRLIFTSAGHYMQGSLFYELPIITGAVVGLAVTVLLWRTVRKRGRILLTGAAAAGGGSVVIDVFSRGVFWEDCLKLVAELLVVLMLAGETDG